MARTCSVCTHEQVEAINLSLLSGSMSIRRIAEKFGLSVGAVHRHKQHMQAQMIQAEPVDVTDTSNIMRQIQELNQRADMLYRSAVQANDRMNTVRALKELRELLILYARLTGELNTQQNVIHQHLHVSPEWASLRSVMLKALQPYPEARAALVAALEGIQALVEGDMDE